MCKDREYAVRPAAKRKPAVTSDHSPVAMPHSLPTAHVLIVSTVLDLATDAVVRALTARNVCVTRWNTEDYPFASRLTVAATQTATSAILTPSLSAPVDLSAVTAVWYRRVRTPEAPRGMDEGVYDFCLRESRASLLGTLLGALPIDARWMSAPTAVWSAEHKVLQLAVARECELLVPDTLVTNDADAARAAFDRFGKRMVAKPVRTGYVEVGGVPHAIFTSAVAIEDLADMHGADLSPVIYQPLIDKRCDVRVTVVGDRVFIAEIDSQTEPSAQVDWRRTDDPLLPHRRGTLPPKVEEQVVQLMRRLGLAYGAIDFIATPDGRLIFLEVNPNGQWLWLDDQLDLGITSAIADWLAPESCQATE